MEDTPGAANSGVVVAVRGYDELVKFPGDVLGIAFNVDEGEIGVVLLGEYWHLHAGDQVERTGRVMDMVVGDELLGRVIDPLGRPLDGGGSVTSSDRLPIERTAAQIMDRAPVTAPLQTGLKVIDALIPVGRGQRELILGDCQTGKTAIAIDTILNQRHQNVLCVYCAIGQHASTLAKAIASRLASMERADTNIHDLLEQLHGTFHRLRQSGIDNELFDVIAGFEALVGSQ